MINLPMEVKEDSIVEVTFRPWLLKIKNVQEKEEEVEKSIQGKGTVEQSPCWSMQSL